MWRRKKKVSLIMKSAWMTLFLFLSLFESVWKLNKCVYYREQRKVFRSCFDWSKLRKKARSLLRFDVMLLWQFILCYVLASYSHMIDLKICKKTTNTMTSKPRERKKLSEKQSWFCLSKFTFFMIPRIVYANHMELKLSSYRDTSQKSI